MLRHLGLTAMLVSGFAACMPPSYAPGYVYYLPAVPLHAYPPAPYPIPTPAADWYKWQPPPPQVQFETPSLAVRNLAMKISESAANGDCATAKATGDELERVDADSHHAILAVDATYAKCVRGF